MKHKVGKWMAGAQVALAVLVAPAAAQQPEQPPRSPELRLPAALERGAEPEPGHSVRYREYRIGGRLERVVVPRENGLNGFTEIYENHRKDSVWSAQENEIGEVPNKRQWIIRTW